MKLEVAKKDLVEALSLVGQAARERSTLPILQTLLLETEASGLRLLGCDGEMWVERKILANISEEGGVCVPAGTFQQAVNAFRDGVLHLESDGSSLVAKQGGSEWKFLGLPTDDFPEIPPVEGQNCLTLAMGELRAAIDGVSYAVADDGSRPYLTGVLFTYDGNELFFVATDTARLAVYSIRRQGIGSSVNAIVPDKALKVVKSLPMTPTEEITLQFDASRVSVEAGTVRFVSQLLEGTYPNWQKVIPVDYTRCWTFDRTEMIDDLKRMMILARDASYRVKFTGQEQRVVITARSEEKGEAKEEIDVVSKNGDVAVAFNCRFVLEALSAFQGASVRVEMTEPTRAAVFRGVDESADSHYCVIMPMALA